MKPRALAALILVLSATPSPGARPAERTAIRRTDVAVSPALSGRLAASRIAVLADLRPAVEAANDTKEEVLDRNGVGPSQQPLRLHEQLPVRGLELFDLSNLRDLSTLSLEVYQDGNPASGIFYYVPRLYFLKWDSENDYYLTVDYKPESAGAKNVVLDARLTPGEVDNDVQLLEKLIRIYLKGQPRRPDSPLPEQVKVYPLPATYEARFNWTALGVDEGDVTVTGVDRDSGQLGLQVATDVATKQILIKRLGDPQGLQGSVAVSPQRVTEGRPAPAAFSVEARLKLADSEAYARARWKPSRTAEYSLFANQHPFPVTLRHLAYLVDSPTGLAMRGYDLQSQRIAPGGVARLPNSKVGAEIDDGSRVLRAWYRYRIENETEYRERVIDRLTGGVGVLPVRKVAIDVVRGTELFTQFHLFKIVVVVRSIHFDPDPESREAVEQSYEFAAGESHRELAPLYQRDAAGEPLFEFRIGLATEEGELYQDAEWRRPTAGFENMIVIGSRQVEEVLAQ